MHFPLSEVYNIYKVLYELKNIFILDRCYLRKIIIFLSFFTSISKHKIMHLRVNIYSRVR